MLYAYISPLLGSKPLRCSPSIDNVLRDLIKINMQISSLWRSILIDAIDLHQHILMFLGVICSLSPICWCNLTKPRFGQTYIRFSVHQKRSDAKAALKNLLFDGKPPPQYFQVSILVFFSFDSWLIMLMITRTLFRTSSYLF